MIKLREQIEQYEPYNEQEEKDKETILKYIDTFDDVLTRNNEFGHFTAKIINWKNYNVELKEKINVEILLYNS